MTTVATATPMATQSGAVSRKKPPSKKAPKRWNWKKPAEKPKRNLSAYNFFFEHVRLRILEQERPGQRVGGFGTLARRVSAEWHTLADCNPALLAECHRKAHVDRERYQAELVQWNDNAVQNAMVVDAPTASTSTSADDGTPQSQGCWSSFFADHDTNQSHSLYSAALPNHGLPQTPQTVKPLPVSSGHGDRIQMDSLLASTTVDCVMKDKRQWPHVRVSSSSRIADQNHGILPRAPELPDDVAVAVGYEFDGDDILAHHGLDDPDLFSFLDTVDFPPLIEQPRLSAFC